MSSNRPPLNNGVGKDEESKAKKVLRKELETMQREMEIATYATNRQGQAVRVIPKAQSLERTLKRKSLEKDDAKERAIEVTFDERNIVEKSRIRGARAALSLDEDTTFDPNEMIFMEDQQNCDSDSASSNSVSMELEEEEDEEIDIELTDDDVDEDQTEEQDEIEDGLELGGDLNFSRNSKDSLSPSVKGTNCLDEGKKQINFAMKKTKSRLSGVKMARTMYRLKNFSSQRLAEKHGDALGAHARGQQRQAVRKLAEVAAAAPIAPQLYSSLGLVYENMLHESGKEIIRKKRKFGSEKKDSVSAAEVSSIIKLGEKAYASYHVAAVLCKKDFTLWVRAGDAACEIADLYDDAMLDLEIPRTTKEKFFSEKLKWLTEAKEDYEAADKLKPPGITVPAKLASIQIQLGNLAEALTILTDMKNASFRLSIAASRRCNIEGGVRARTEMEQSFTAWLLYADLMLRIGHECIAWNSGTSTTENFMFKRWLKKYSLTFDWKERRLQALCAALEAAAGSKSCRDLVAWSRSRAKPAQETTEDSNWSLDDYDTTQQGQNSEEGATSDMKLSINGDSRVEESGIGYGKSSKPGNGTVERKFDSEYVFMEMKNALFEKNRAELENFDFCTAHLNLDSKGLAARKNERDQLLKQQRLAVVSFIGNHQLQKCDVNLITEAALPVSASCGVVCKIAGQLLRHCLDLALFKGGKVAAEATASYLKKRYFRSQHRKKSLERCWNRIEAKGKDILQTFEQSHDELQSQTDNEENSDHDVILSDDDEIDNRGDEALVLSLKSGVLPPDLKFLYALSLLGEGGNDFAALKMLSSVNDLDAECRVRPADIDLVPDKSWFLFQRTATGELQRRDALLLLSDILRSKGIEESWAKKVLPFFYHSSSDVYCFGEKETGEWEKNRNFFLAHSRLKLYSAISDAEYKPLSESIESALSIINSIAQAHQELLWEESSSAAHPNPTSVLIIEIISKAFSFISGMILKCKGGFLRTDLMEKLIRSVNSVVRIFFDIRIPSVESIIPENQIVQEAWASFPFLSNWQDTVTLRISDRCFLLCAGINVALFSGWGNEDFNLETLYSKRGSAFFGVKVFGPQMAGHLPPHSETLLSTLWRKVYDIIPSMPPLNFDNHLRDVKKSQWYIDTAGKFNDLSERRRIATLGEDFGLDLLLSLAAINLYSASAEAAPLKKDIFVRNAMSVILPVTQFCLDTKVWESSIGRGVEAEETVRAWDYYINERATLDENTESPQHSVTKPRSKPIFTSVTTAALRSSMSSNKGGVLVQKTWKPSSSKVARVPISLLMKEWKLEQRGQKNSKLSPCDSLLPSRVSMKKVDFAMKQLRSCLTVQALQKASIKVASALLEIAADPLCNNPFLCLSHATIFAGHGPKGGNSDEPFKRKLPNSEEECTPLEALLILGRADCLRAVAFTDEAIFLCSYVAKVVARHRNRSLTDYDWTSQWRVIGIQTYALGASIDASIESFLKQEPTTEIWESDVVQELRLCKKDAQCFEKANMCAQTPKHHDTAAGRVQDYAVVSDDYNNIVEDTQVDSSDYYSLHEQNLNLFSDVTDFYDADEQSDNESQLVTEEV